MHTKAPFILLILFTLLVLAFVLTACDWDVAGGGSVLGTPRPDSPSSYNLTATYGAGQLYIQLTAVAGDRQENQVSSTGGAAGP